MSPAELVRILQWEERFYTPPPPGSDLFKTASVKELRHKFLYTTLSGWWWWWWMSWWWWCIESVFRYGQSVNQESGFQRF